MSKTTFFVLLAFTALGCRTSMNRRPDASSGPEAASPDSTNAPDLVGPDSGGADTSGKTGRPDEGTPDTLPDRNPEMDMPSDSPMADTERDLLADTLRPLLSEVAGHAFQIAANEALPDAGLAGRSCADSNPGAVYRLTFSDDAGKVTIVRTDSVQESILTGRLQSSSSSNLRYDLMPSFAGASLLVRRDSDDLIGELVMLGSGVPVIWCIESPMKAL